MQTPFKCAYYSNSPASLTVEGSWARCVGFFHNLIPGSQTRNRQGNIYWCVVTIGFENIFG